MTLRFAWFMNPLEKDNIRRMQKDRTDVETENKQSILYGTFMKKFLLQILPKMEKRTLGSRSMYPLPNKLTK